MGFEPIIFYQFIINIFRNYIYSEYDFSEVCELIEYDIYWEKKSEGHDD